MKLLNIMPASVRCLILSHGQLKFVKRQRCNASIESLPSPRGILLDVAVRLGVAHYFINFDRKVNITRILIVINTSMKLIVQNRPLVTIVNTLKTGLLGGLAAAILRVFVRFMHFMNLGWNSQRL